MRWKKIKRQSINSMKKNAHNLKNLQVTIKVNLKN